MGRWSMEQVRALPVPLGRYALNQAYQMYHRTCSSTYAKGPKLQTSASAPTRRRRLGVPALAVQSPNDQLCRHVMHSVYTEVIALFVQCAYVRAPALSASRSVWRLQSACTLTHALGRALALSALRRARVRVMRWQQQCQGALRARRPGVQGSHLRCAARASQ